MLLLLNEVYFNNLKELNLSLPKIKAKK